MIEAKKIPTNTESASNARKLSHLVSDIKTEFAKISWTSPEELRVYTKIVVGATFAFGLGIYFLDLIIQFFLNGLSMFVRMLGG